MKPSYPWSARLIVGIIMLALAFLGMTITDLGATGGVNYWKWMVIIYAILALGLSWYVKRKEETVSPITLWHEVLHWLGLICTIFLVTYLVHLGTISRFAAGIFQLILLGLALFLAGIYIESTFIVIGIVLGVFALLTAVLAQYVYFIIIPIVILAIAVNIIMLWFSHRKFKKKNE